MIIVLGSVTVKEGHIKDALELSQRHVNHSRAEPGCITHGVHLDSEDPQRLVFVEKWKDMDSLTRHFKEPTSIEFVNKLKALSASAPELSLYEAEEIQ